MLKTVSHCLVALALFVGVAGKAIALEAGEKLAALALNDQFEKPLQLEEQTQYLLFSKDMAGGEVVQEALTENPVAASGKLVYFADISGMPSLIARFVAIPKMQDYDFVLGLDREGEVTASLPVEEKAATLIELDNFKVKSVSFFESADELKQALK
ncbi:hypothetical protein G3R49_11795 [Shewanella sp. WXL01]|uniref:FAD/FMN-containing dehydrogenase n=1 Tax=Shewanella maritima TaxID=2520507 RepID=A0A411PJJ2_9GAMM|nr:MULTISPECIES: hypothetical protein [Shewanella]NKF51237.1 hypothetical protein [Shewanella sp. WXL01]QBF83550.1 hypothetical protein EXU30_13245 [Shewanella maritima]